MNRTSRFPIGQSARHDVRGASHGERDGRVRKGRGGVRHQRWLIDGGACLDVEVVHGWGRLRGLIGRCAPDPATALLFRDCRSLHGCWIGFPLDVVFVDSRLRVVEIASLQPWRVASCLGARHALELRAGECERLGIARADAFRRARR